MAFGGEGVGRSAEGKVVFVPGAAPGDKLRIRVLADHGRYERAEIVEILEKSTFRVDPPCSVFGTCGGCQWQYLRYETQLKMKEDILRDALQRVGRVPQPNVLPMIPAENPWHYRHRIQLKVDSEKQIGFYALKSHQVIPFEECLIADQRLNEKLIQIRQSPKLSELPFELAVTEAGLVEKWEGEEGPFSQVNPEQNKSLIRTVLEMAFGKAELAFTQKKTVVELYAGSGNFTFPLSERVGQIFAVESSHRAVRRGEEETLRRRIENIHWIPGDAEWGLKKIYRMVKEGKLAVDLLVLDPPRHGARKILDLVPLIRPRQIVYVSCDPMTLSRDLEFLCRRHYRLECVQPVDMFPQTYHIESVAQLILP